MEKIMQGRMDRGYFRYQKEYEDKALEVLRSGWYILGKEVEKTPLPDGIGEGPEYTKREKKRSNTRRHGRWHSRGNGSKNNQKKKNHAHKTDRKNQPGA